MGLTKMSEELLHGSVGPTLSSQRQGFVIVLTASFFLGLLRLVSIFG